MSIIGSVFMVVLPMIATALFYKWVLSRMEYREKVLCNKNYVTFMGQETTFGYTLDVEVSRTIWNAAWNAALKSAGQGLLWNPEKTSEWNTCFQLKAKKLYYLKLEDSAYADFMEWKYPLLSDKGNLSHTTWDTAWNTALNVVETEIRKDYCWIPEMV